MLSYESIQWRAKQAARRDTTFLEKIPSSLLAPSSEPTLSPKIFVGEGEIEAGSVHLCALAACRSLHLIQSWYMFFSRYALSIRSELQPNRWDADEWWDESCDCVLPWEPRGSGWHWSFPAKGKERAAAVSSALLPRGGKSTYMVSWDPNLTNLESTPARCTKLQQCLLGIAW